MDISAHIGQLVMEHECVIIPGLGGFITNYHAAEINQRQYSIQPPSRKLVFNAQLNTNDGLLAHHLSQRLDISYKTSLLLLEVFSNYCLRDLEEGKRIAFGDLGILDMNIHNKLEFFPNTTINYNQDAFGFKPLSLKAIERKPDFNLKAPIQQTVVKPHITKVLSLDSLDLKKIAAVLIPIVFIVSAVFFLPSLNQNKSLQQTSVFSFLDSLKSNDLSFSTEETQPEIDNTINNESIEDQSNIPSELTENKSDNTTKQSEFIIQDREFEISKGQYHIICGSFIEKTRAEVLVNRLKSEGFSAYVADRSKSGSYRVSMQSFANEQDAIQQMKWVRNQGYDNVWILKKAH